MVVSMPLIASMVFASCFMQPAPANAAAFTLGTAPCDMRFDGQLFAGDETKFSERLRSLEGQERERAVVCLNSPGGNYPAALAIAKAMLSARISVGTRVERGALCLSACAIIFLAGHHGKTNSRPFRQLDAAAELGFHAPYIAKVNDIHISSDPGITMRTFHQGVQAIGALLAVADDAMFPETLIAAALKSGPRDFLMVDTIDRLGQWRIDLIGYRLPRVTRRDVFEACRNMMEWARPGFTRTNKEPPTRVRFTGGCHRAVHAGFGDEASKTCVADVAGRPPGDVCCSMFNGRRTKADDELRSG
ncbi:MAG: ATP-dependent Clp protease proteolytic subunit [Hyphomicrobiaceae bacterium]